jgi:hypothetical protein
MIDNIVPISPRAPLSTAERLYALARKAELEPEKYKYMITMTASSTLENTDWAMGGKPSLVTLLGMLEVTKDEVLNCFIAMDAKG